MGDSGWSEFSDFCSRGWTPCWILYLRRRKRCSRLYLKAIQYRHPKQAWLLNKLSWNIYEPWYLSNDLQRCEMPPRRPVRWIQIFCSSTELCVWVTSHIDLLIAQAYFTITQAFSGSRDLMCILSFHVDQRENASITISRSHGVKVFFKVSFQCVCRPNRTVELRFRSKTHRRTCSQNTPQSCSVESWRRGRL